LEAPYSAIQCMHNVSYAEKAHTQFAEMEFLNGIFSRGFLA